MNLQQLNHFLALAETGSFSRASEKVHLTQSALSRSIQSLEQELGLQLIDRIGKRNELTPFGLAVVEKARRIVLDTRELKRLATLFADGKTGIVRIAMGAALRARSLDALIVNYRELPLKDDLNVALLEPMRSGFIVRRDHPLTEHQNLGFEALLDYPIVSSTVSDGNTRKLVERYGQLAHPQSWLNVSSEDIPAMIEAIHHTDAIFMGIFASAHKALIQEELSVLKIQPQADLYDQYAFVTLRGRTEAPALELVRSFCFAFATDRSVQRMLAYKLEPA